MDDLSTINDLRKRRKREQEIIDGDLPTTRERLTGLPPLRGSEADDRRVFLQQLLLSGKLAPELEPIVEQARDDGSDASMLGAIGALEPSDDFADVVLRLRLILSVTGHQAAIADVIAAIGRVINGRWRSSLVDRVYLLALATGLRDLGVNGSNDVADIVEMGLDRLRSESERFAEVDTALKELAKPSEAPTEAEDAAGALARIAREQDAVEAAASVGPGLVVVPALDLKAGSIARRDTVKSFEAVAGKRLELIEPYDLLTARDRLLTRYPHFSVEIDLILRQRLPFRLLLVGSAGCGKTSLAKALADALKLPSVTYPSGGSSDSSFAGTSAQWSSVRASVPLQLIQRSLTANPLVIVDEIEKAGSSRHNGALTDSLLAFLEPSSASRILDPALELEVDLSAVSYIATGNELAGVPGPLLDRLRVVKMPDAGPEHIEQLVGTALDDIASERSIDRRWLAPLAADEVDLVRQSWPGGSLRRLRRIVELVVDGRDQVMGRA